MCIRDSRIGDDLLVGEVDDIGGMLHNVGEDGDVAGVLGQGIRQDEVKGLSLIHISR